MTDQIKQLVESLRGLDLYAATAAAVVIERLSAENEELKRDEERYRWIREKHDADDPQWFVYGATSYELLDTCIDSDIAAHGEIYPQIANHKSEHLVRQSTLLAEKERSKAVLVRIRRELMVKDVSKADIEYMLTKAIEAYEGERE